MPAILFVCYANQFRSPVAALFMREKLQEAEMEGDWQVQSAGTWMHTSTTLNPELLRELQQLGVRLDDHLTRPVDAEILTAHDIIIAMEQGQKEGMEADFPGMRGRVFLLSEIVEGIVYDIPDPIRDRHVTYEEVARDLKVLIDRGFEEICRRASALENTG